MLKNFKEFCIKHQIGATIAGLMLLVVIAFPYDTESASPLVSDDRRPATREEHLNGIEQRLKVMAHNASLAPGVKPEEPYQDLLRRVQDLRAFERSRPKVCD